MGKGRKPETLYSVWRNSDDTLLILDGTAEECSKVIGITMRTFVERLSRVGGDQEKYTIRKIRREDAKREEES